MRNTPADPRHAQGCTRIFTFALSRFLRQRSCPATQRSALGDLNASPRPPTGAHSLPKRERNTELIGVQSSTATGTPQGPVSLEEKGSKCKDRASRIQPFRNKGTSVWRMCGWGAHAHTAAEDLREHKTRRRRDTSAIPRDLYFRLRPNTGVSDKLQDISHLVPTHTTLLPFLQMSFLMLYSYQIWAYNCQRTTWQREAPLGLDRRGQQGVNFLMGKVLASPGGGKWYGPPHFPAWGATEL
jgi:hypothetical protein